MKQGIQQLCRYKKLSYLQSQILQRYFSSSRANKTVSKTDSRIKAAVWVKKDEKRLFFIHIGALIQPVPDLHKTLVLEYL